MNGVNWHSFVSLSHNTISFTLFGIIAGITLNPYPQNTQLLLRQFSIGTSIAIDITTGLRLFFGLLLVNQKLRLFTYNHLYIAEIRWDNSALFREKDSSQIRNLSHIDSRTFSHFKIHRACFLTFKSSASVMITQILNVKKVAPLLRCIAMGKKGVRIENCPRCGKPGLLIERLMVTTTGMKKYKYRRLNVAHYVGCGISKNGKRVDRIHWCYLNAQQLTQLRLSSVSQTVTHNVTQTVRQTENGGLCVVAEKRGSPGWYRSQIVIYTKNPLFVLEEHMFLILFLEVLL